MVGSLVSAPSGRPSRGDQLSRQRDRSTGPQRDRENLRRKDLPSYERRTTLVRLVETVRAVLQEEAVKRGVHPSEAAPEGQRVFA